MILTALAELTCSCPSLRPLPMAESKRRSDALRAKVEQLCEQFEDMIAAAEGLNKDIESEALTTVLSPDRKLMLIAEVEDYAQTIVDTFDEIVKMKLSPSLIEEWSVTVDRLSHDKNYLIQLVSSNEAPGSAASTAESAACEEIERESKQVEMAIQKVEAKLGALMSRAKQLRRPVMKPEVSPAYEPLNSTVSRPVTSSPALPVAASVISDSNLSQQVADMASSIDDWKEAMLASSRYARALPSEPAVFTGNPLEYPDWIAAFESLIDAQPYTPMEKMHHLRKFVDGSAKKAISGYFLLQNEKAYVDAKEMLKRFGNPHVIALAFRDQLNRWPKVGKRDGKALQELTDFLHQCLTAMGIIPELEVLSDSQENQKILTKLPEGLVNRWVRIADRAIENQGKFPSFKEFCEFMRTESNIACSPLVPGNVPSFQTSNTSRKQSHALKTQTKTAEPPQTRKCLYCEKDNHTTAACFRLAKQPYDKQQDFVKRSRLCFACLKPGHMTRQCQKRSQCGKCNKSHPTSLHKDLTDASNAPATMQTSSDTNKNGHVTQHIQ